MKKKLFRIRRKDEMTKLDWIKNFETILLLKNNRSNVETYHFECLLYEIRSFFVNFKCTRFIYYVHYDVVAT